MRRIISSEFLTLDGVMESPEKWQPAYISDDVAETIQSQIQGYAAMLLGRVTYEVFAAYWPLQTNNEFGISDKLNSMPKYVVSSTLEKAEWNNSTLIKKNLVEEVRNLKQEGDGDIQLTGSANLVQALLQADLIDEYRLLVHPIIVGSGKRLFKDGLDITALKLMDSKIFSSGVVALTYQPDKKEESR